MFPLQVYCWKTFFSSLPSRHIFLKVLLLLYKVYIVFIQDYFSYMYNLWEIRINYSDYGSILIFILFRNCAIHHWDVLSRKYGYH